MLVAVDVTLTLLHPTARGPLSYLVNRLTWRAVRALSLRLAGGRWLSYAGPLAIGSNVMAWVVVLWVGYALAYLPFIDSFRFDPDTPFQGRGFVEALYVSGAILTTVGFGDVVPTGDVLRLTIVVEAASGFGALSAAIAYVLSVYPLTTDLRRTALRLVDHGVVELAGAVRAVRDTGTSMLPDLTRDMTEVHEHLRRFPVLYYFESGDEREPLSSLLRGTALLLVALRCADPGAGPHAPIYGDVVERILDRLLGDLERDFVGGRRPGSGPHVGDRLDEQVIEALCASVDPHFAGAGRVGRPAELRALLARTEAVLAAVAHEHGHRSQPLLPDA